MSLHSLANHLQSAGRGQDSVLVHMTPGEVNGLQSLAMAQGGSLTINPETGLPEAGILKSLLPMLAGGALTFFSGGALSPLAASMIVGGGTAAATGSLKKGLMAGLGAYGGAGMGAGLSSMANPAAAASGQGLTATNAGVGLQNTGATVGLRAPGAVSTTGVDMATAGFKNPVLDSGFTNVLNAPVTSVGPADASKFLGTDTTNQSILQSKAIGYQGPGSLPVAGAKPVPFSDISTSVDPRTLPGGPLHEPVPQLRINQPRPDTYYAPTDTSKPMVRGFGAQRGTPLADSGGVYSGSYRDVGDNVLLRGHQQVSNVAQTSPLDAVPVDAKVAQGPIDLTYDGIPYKYGDGRQSISFGEGHTLLGGPAPKGPIDLTYDGIPYKYGDGRQSISFGEGHTLLRDPSVPVVDKSKLQAAIGRPAGRIDVLPGDPPLAQPRSITGPFRERMSDLGSGIKNSFSVDGLKGLYAASEAAAPYGMYAGLGSTAYSMYEEKRQQMEDEARARARANQGLIRPYEFDYGVGSGESVSSQPYYGSAERTYFRPTYTAGKPYKAPGPEYAAKGGLMGLAVGGPVEQMAAMNAVGANTGYPMAKLQTPMYSNSTIQNPEATNVVAPSADAGVGTYTGEARFMAGGLSNPTTKNLGGSADPNYTRREAAGGRSGVATPDPKALSGYKYDYDPNTMQFTQTGGPGASKTLTGKELAQGMGAMDMSKRFNEMAITGKPYNFTPSFVSGATPSGTTSGGMAQPAMQSANPAQPFAPTTIVPAYQTPEQQLGLGGFYDMLNQQMGGYGGYAAGGGVSHLGDYSDGGRLLKGPGDGVSDSIPASIGNRQPARLADGEFVVPARIVSEIGNGSTEAGARKLYAMMERVQRARRKTTGKNQVAKNTKAERLLPA